jgi:hypothetical protein
MNKIIQQICQEGIKNLQERVIHLIQSGGGLSETVSGIMKATSAQNTTASLKNMIEY